ncbi:MAG: alpha,alpha-trehalase [Candidatus Aminicenantes bacterium]|nr:alpha,alpha-trehalase [Candidatus Aminicenantes bacterium]MDH5743048.1 alpha,alpha-trehalase [Candidatus Aminicenantes bacterium]
MKHLKIFFLLMSLLSYLYVFYTGLNAEVFYQWKDVYIGSLEAKAWAGLMIVPHPESVFAFRLKTVKKEDEAEGIDHLFLVSEVGPQSPDGQYARMKFDVGLPFGKGNDTPILKKPSKKFSNLVMEWSRQSEKIVIGRISVPEEIELQLIHYYPWDFKGKYQLLPDGHLRGEGSSSEKQYYLFWTSRPGMRVESSRENELTLNFPSDKKVYFVAGVGKDLRILQNQIYRYKNEGVIDGFLEEEEKRYERKRVKIEGLYKGAERAITNNLFWTILYQPGHHRFYTPAGRQWIFPKSDGSSDHWTIFEWDSFFNALLLSVESTKHAKEVMRSVLEAQYPNGNIPNWRGRYGGTPDRSEPPIGSYVVLKCFQKDGDLEFLQYAYPFLKRWHSFWKAKKPNGQARRDGNGDGLLEWGSDTELVASDVPSWEEDASGETRASWESGQDDLPNWDRAIFNEDTGTLTMNCLDLNALYTLDAWSLAEIAKILKYESEFSSYLAEYNHMKDLINRYLWDETEGFYFDRYWDGRFSEKKAASNFYPLIAKIPDQDRALLMIRRLLNEREFWGEYVIPTISRDDPAFKDQEDWRGKVWPPPNYLIYQGLKAYGFDAVASEVAKKSAALFLRSWENFQLCSENFDSRTGEAGGRRFRSWGPLFALIALEEYLDFTPWDGFRFGMIKPERKGKLSRVFIQGRHYGVEVSPSKVKLKEEGRDILEANKSAVFRHFLYSESEVSFEVKTLEETEIKIHFLTKGKYQLEVNNQSVEIFEGKSTKVKVPEGEHNILLLLLEKKD